MKTSSTSSNLTSSFSCAVLHISRVSLNNLRHKPLYLLGEPDQPRSWLDADTCTFGPPHKALGYRLPREFIAAHARHLSVKGRSWSITKQERTNLFILHKLMIF